MYYLQLRHQKENTDLYLYTKAHQLLYIKSHAKYI